MDADVDGDANNTIEFGEFVEVMTGKMGEKDSRDSGRGQLRQGVQVVPRRQHQLDLLPQLV